MWYVMKKKPKQMEQILSSFPTEWWIYYVRVWEMLKEKKIYCWFDPKIKGDMMLGLKLPKGRRIKIITNK